MNIRQIINAARSAFTRARRKFFTRLRNIQDAHRKASYNAEKRPPRISRQEQHRISCRMAYGYKAGLVHLGKGKNTLSGIPDDYTA